MELARDVFRKYAGHETERTLYEQYPDDVDEYINAACSDREDGRLCSRCSKKSVVIELRQTRSADEGMTAYLVCQSCKYRTLFK